MMRRKDGFTLVELMVYILIGSIVTLAGTTVLLMGLRMNRQSSEIAARQNTARIVMQTLEELAAEQDILVVKSGTGSWEIYRDPDGTKQLLFSYNADEDALYSGGAPTMPILEEVVYSDASLDETAKLLTITIEVDGQSYTSKVYCRLLMAYMPAGESSPAVAAETEPILPPDTDWEVVPFAQERKDFLAVLTAQEGSTGADVNTGEYFSEWYIGGYEGKPGWDTQTPWCACFVSWALEKSASNLVKVPKFADVAKFWADFGLGYRKKTDPKPGDLIFFDWEVNAIEYPQHVGVVTEVKNGYVHTIEGNVDGRVEKRQYQMDNPYILGYGILQWQ